MSHAFLSYVSEDWRTVAHMKNVLEANGITCWMDKADLSPGLPWKDQLRKAIQSGSYFVPFFSPNWTKKASSTANEEVLWAIDELRRRPHDVAWFMSFVLPGGRVPDLPIGADRCLTDLQYISIDTFVWCESSRRLLRAMQVTDPILDAGEPLAAGFASKAEVVGGQYTVDHVEPQIDAISHLDFTIESGEIWRDDAGIIHARMVARAPHTELAATNRLLGLDHIVCQTAEATISRDPDHPTSFTSQRNHVIPRNSQIPAMFGQPASRIPFDLPILLTYSANGCLLENDIFEGGYAASFTIASLRVRLRGSFSVKVQPSFEPAPYNG